MHSKTMKLKKSSQHIHNLSQTSSIHIYDDAYKIYLNSHSKILFYYQINKFMQKSSIEKLLKAEGHYAGDLVSLDFKSESLHSFLENVVQIVNQHSQRINAVELDKVATEDLRKGNISILNAGKLNPALTKELSVQNPNKTDSLSDTVESISANFSNHSNALQYLSEGIKKLNQRVQNLSGLLDSFQTKQNVKEGLRKVGVAAKKYSQEDADKVLTRLKDLEMKSNKRMSEFQNLTKEVEKKTLWKISECETSLLKKITPEYVEKALEQLQNKIHNDISNNKSQQLNELKFNIENQKAKLEGINRNVEEYEKENKALIKELQEASKSFEKREKIDHDRRDNDMRLKELLIKIDRLEKREDPQDLELRITKITAEHNERILAQTEKTRKLQGDLASINNVMASMGGVEGGSGLDPHKLCHMDGEVRRLRDSNRTNEVKLQALEDEVKMKLLTFQERIMTTLGMLKGQDNFVSREEMYESISRLREPVMEKMNQNQNLIYEVNGKLSKLELFQKATKRKIKELTRGDDLNKILDMKLNIGQADAQFNGVNMKLENLEIVLNKLRMEVEANSSFLKLLENEINEPEQGINIIGPKQKVFPAKCLGCGMKHNPAVHDNNMMQGTDGKYYKVDLKNSYLYDQREVYGVTPSQIAIYESGVKKRITSATNRPTSSRTNIRPSSAKHF